MLNNTVISYFPSEEQMINYKNKVFAHTCAECFM